MREQRGNVERGRCRPRFFAHGPTDQFRPGQRQETGNWHGCSTKDINPVMLTDTEGRTVRIRTPVMDLEGLITPPPALYRPTFRGAAGDGHRCLALRVGGEVKAPLCLNFDQLRRFPGRSVRTVMECSGSDATYFEYFKGEGPKPSRTQEAHDPQRQRVDRGAARRRAPGGRADRKIALRPRRGQRSRGAADGRRGHQALLLRQGSADRKGAPPRHHSSLGAERPVAGASAWRSGASLGAWLVRQLVGKVAYDARADGDASPTAGITTSSIITARLPTTPTRN